MSESLKYPQVVKGKEKDDLIKQISNEFKDAELPSKDSMYRDVRHYDQNTVPSYLTGVIDNIMKFAERETSKYEVLMFIHHRKAAAKFEYKDLKACCILNLAKPEVYKVHSGTNNYHLMEDGDLIVVKDDHVLISTQNKTTFRFNNKVYARSAGYVRYTVVVVLY